MKRLVIGLVAAIVLLVAVDYAAAATAEYQVSSRLRQQLALPDDPAVKINGFPFLTQALGGDYQRVEVSADRLTVGQMNNVGVRAQLYHVRLPLGEVLSGTLRSIHIDDLQGTVQVTDEDLRRQLRGVTKLKVQPVDPGALDAALANSKDAMPGSSVTGITPDQAVRLVATTDVLGQKTEVSVIAVLQLAGRQIQISPRDIRLGSGPAATRSRTRCRPRCAGCSRCRSTRVSCPSTSPPPRCARWTRPFRSAGLRTMSPLPPAAAPATRE